ncbi:MAG: AbrB/MazE/SpoVT family DNA-binding domain-containing protein [Thaumarchaeota archaeon]|nr:MAG: AbrB/MazE/SpoVT family DNA-binding domain-containing protein [Nitrososphaerota archaeon]
MTVSKSSQVRVKRKGQVTIPSVIRARLGIEEGSLLEVEEQRGAIVLKPAPPLKGGKVVGEETHKQVIRELDRLRRDWR